MRFPSEVAVAVRAVWPPDKVCSSRTTPRYSRTSWKTIGIDCVCISLGEISPQARVAVAHESREARKAARGAVCRHDRRPTPGGGDRRRGPCRSRRAGARLSPRSALGVACGRRPWRGDHLPAAVPARPNQALAGSCARASATRHLAVERSTEALDTSHRYRRVWAGEHQI
jgi:hypothetical protein